MKLNLVKSHDEGTNRLRTSQALVATNAQKATTPFGEVWIAETIITDFNNQIIGTLGYTVMVHGLILISLVPKVEEAIAAAQKWLDDRFAEVKAIQDEASKDEKESKKK